MQVVVSLRVTEGDFSDPGRAYDGRVGGFVPDQQHAIGIAPGLILPLTAPQGPFHKRRLPTSGRHDARSRTRPRGVRLR